MQSVRKRSHNGVARRGFIWLALMLVLGCSAQHAAPPAPPPPVSPPPEKPPEGRTAVEQPEPPPVVFTWERPRQNQNGTPLTDLAGYRLYYGYATRNYTTRIDVGTQTSYALSGLTAGHTYFFAVTAYDTSGNESLFSEEIRLSLPGSVATRAPAMPVLEPISLVRGEKARFQVEGVQPGSEVLFFFSLQGTGSGPCSPDLGGLCLDLRSPQLFGKTTADDGGRATLFLPIPENARAGQQLAIQAVVHPRTQTGRFRKTNAVLTRVR